MKLRTVINPDDSYIIDELTVEDLDETVHGGAFFNRQKVGLRVREFLKEGRINKRFQVVATYKTSTTKSSGTPHIVDEEEFIAIMESKDMPLYFINFQIDYT